jgi:hypothetical protein
MRGGAGMQIIEVTELGVRSAVIRMRRRETPLRFVLYPMIHMAKQGFCTAVTRRLEQADVVVVEGVGGGRRKRSVLASALMFSYTVMRFNRRAGLVEQEIDYKALSVPIVHPDVSLEEFEASWRRMPLIDRLGMWCVLPVVVVAHLFGGTRTSGTGTGHAQPTGSPSPTSDLSPSLHHEAAAHVDATMAGW